MKGRGFGAFAKRLAAVAFSAAACVAAADLPAGAGVGPIDWNDAEVRRRAILETAYAYYLKADCVQYGSASLVARAGMAFCRRTKEGRPEDATPDSPYYTVCSSFPYEVYYNAIGFKLSGGSDTAVTINLTTRPQEGVTVFDYDKRLDHDGSKYGPEMRRMRGLLQVGDIIVYSKITGKDKKTGAALGGGHAMMYVGDVAGDGRLMVMHSGGAKYDFATGIDQVEKSGTIRLGDLDASFLQNGTMAKQTKVMVFRPLDLPAERYPLSESAKMRYLHPRLRMDRRVDVGPFGSVVSGGELNYSLTLRNYSGKPYSVPVREPVPDGCELVSHTALPAADCQPPPSRRLLVWDVPLTPGEERKLEWCVKVTAPAGSRIVADGGMAAGIPSNALVTEVVPRRMSAAVARAWAEANIHSAADLPDCRVSGWAGGRQAHDPPRGVRVRDPRMGQLMEGDVVVVCPSLKQPRNFRLWTKGRGGLEEMTPRGIRWVTDAEVTALLAKDLFVALRPASTRHAEDPLSRQRAVVAKAFDYHRKRESVQTALSFVNDVYLNTIGYSFCDPSSTTVSNLVETPPPGIVMFEYDARKDPGRKRYRDEMERMWSIIEPGDVVAFMTDRSAGKKKPRNHAILYVGDCLRDGHAQMLQLSGDGADVATGAGRTITMSLFDGLLHGRNINCLRARTKVVVLRPLALPAAKWPLKDAAIPADCVRNGSFESGAKHWQLTDGWSVGRGFGRNGSGGLVFESAAKNGEAVFAEQIVDVVPGKVYDFETWLDAPRGVSMSIHYLDGDGKRVGGIFSGARSSNKGWGRLWVRTTRLPANVRKVRLRPFVPAGFTGKACFDDISFKLHEVEPVTTICSSCYRDEAAPDDGKVTFFAGIDLDDAGCGRDDVDVVFSFDSPCGERVRRKADRFDGTDASVEVAQDDIKMGAQEIAAEVVKRDGSAIGRRTLRFARLAERPARPVHFDRWKRTVLNGKPFFPLAVYCTRAESNIIARVGKTSFNTLMAYHKLDWALLDWCRENGLMAIAHVGDLSSYDTSIARKVSQLKGHPAMLAWLVNDERPLAMMSQIMSRYRTVREADPGHPTWAVLYQVDQMRGYVGTCDAIGSDPYPIPHASLALAHSWVEKTRSATFGAMPVWQTIQIFDWAAYKTKGEPGTDVSKYRAPTLAEMKIMAWLQIAGGSNALLMYSYNPLEKMSWRDPFEKKWEEVCECADEIASVSDILLSVEEPPAIGDVPQSLSVRTWRTGGKAHVLLCNATGKRLKATVPLGGAAKFGAMHTMHGGGVSMAGDDSIAVDFPPEGYAFLSFGR